MYSDLALFIDGKWLNGEGRKGEEVINPATGKTLGTLPHASAADLDAALAAAEKGFAVWRATSAYDRAKIMRKAADLVRERFDHISKVQTQEQGKPYPESRAEVLTSADIIEWYAEEGRRSYGRIVPGRQKGVRQIVFISWVGLRGAVGIFLASIPLLVGLPAAYLYFDVAFVVVLFSLLIQGWTVALSARKLDISFARSDPLPRRVELDLPGQLAREIVGYPVPANSPYLRRGLIPNWARPTLVIRNEEILTPVEAEPVREGDYVYLLAPLEKAQALDRFFVNMPPPRSPDPALLGDFFVPGTATLGALAEIYGLQVAADHTEVQLADFFPEHLGRKPKNGDIVALGPIALLAHKVEKDRVTTVGLRLAEPEMQNDLTGQLKSLWQRLMRLLG